jgi:hypothetical protein
MPCASSLKLHSLFSCRSFLALAGFGQMDQTHLTRGVSAVLVLSVLSFGLLTGAMLLIGISIVGFWKSLTPSDFVSWFASHSSRLGVIMIPLGAITVAVECEASINEIRENNG